MIRLCAAAAFLVAGCSAPVNPSRGGAGGGGNGSTAPAVAMKKTGRQDEAGPAAPGRRGGQPDDRTPVADARFAETGAQSAAELVQHYYALIEAGRYADARRLWGGNGQAAGKTEAEFAADFAAYRDDHAEVGAPGRIEGAAGSLYVEVPVQLEGRSKDGSPFHQRATVTLRRVNDVPGSTAEQRRWHISGVAAAGPPVGAF